MGARLYYAAGRAAELKPQHWLAAIIIAGCFVAINRGYNGIVHSTLASMVGFVLYGMVRNGDRDRRRRQRR